MDYRVILGIVATGISFVSYVPYIRNILLGKTKPHAFSWLVWSIVTGIGFLGQVSDNAGAGAWVIGSSALLCLIVFLLALRKGEKNIVLMDWLSLLGAIVAIFFWFLTKGPLLSVILVTIIDALGFIPTFRKSYFKPSEETLLTYILSVIKYTLSLIALENFSVVTALFPISLVITNGLFVLMLVIRRKQLGIMILHGLRYASPVVSSSSTISDRPLSCFS